MAQVTYANGTVRTVRNLGWLLNHISDTKRLIIEARPQQGRAFILRAQMNDGAWYHTEYGDFTVLLLRLLLHPRGAHRFAGIPIDFWGCLPNMTTRQEANTKHIIPLRSLVPPTNDVTPTQRWTVAFVYNAELDRRLRDKSAYVLTFVGPAEGR